MVNHKIKSNTFRKIQKRTINGTKNVYTRRKPKRGTCPETGQVLKGVSRLFPKQRKNASKTSKRPDRPFGGVLSSEASRQKHIAKARESDL